MYGQPFRVRSPWVQLAFLLGITGAAYILAMVLMLLVPPAYGIQVMSPASIHWEDPQVIAVFKFLQAVSTLIMFFVPALAYALFNFRGRYFYQLGCRKPIRLNMYVLAVMVILVGFPFVFWLGNLNQQINLPHWMTSLESDASRQIDAFLKVRHTYDIWVNVFIIALLPALCEELFFRGSLQRIIIQMAKEPWLGILITGFLFSAFHMQFEGFLPRMYLGIILGSLYWYSGSIWTSIVAHFVNNAAQVLVVSFAPRYSSENPSIPLYAAIVSGIAIWAILHFYRKQSNITYEKVYDIEGLNPHNEFMA